MELAWTSLAWCQLELSRLSHTSGSRGWRTRSRSAVSRGARFVLCFTSTAVFLSFFFVSRLCSRRSGESSFCFCFRVQVSLLAMISDACGLAISCSVCWICRVFVPLAAPGACVLWPWNLPVAPSDSAAVGGRFRLRAGLPITRRRPCWCWDFRSWLAHAVLYLSQSGPKQARVSLWIGSSWA